MAALCWIRSLAMKILLVEDSRAIAAVMASRLASFGHDVDIAENGALAVDKFIGSTWDLVLMDIEMPVMNGFEATNRIRAHEATRQWAWTPILFLTASDTAENLVTAIEAGGDDFISKTVPETVLQAKMKAMARIAALRHHLAVANTKLAEQASRDGLTGLCNRRYMDMRLDVAWAEAVRLRQPFGILMIDIDNFKKYNDHYGHQAGDDCLRAVASAIATTVGSADLAESLDNSFAARYGGEEFAVIMPAIMSATIAGMAAALVETVSGLALPHELNAQWGRVTTSVGGAHLDMAEGRIADMFRSADARLYQAKHKGRNRAEVTD